ncbi:MAG TPA: cupin, partial [Cyclobacteriaceae bacterium]
TNNNIPNSSFPLVIYKNVFASRGDSGAEWLETHFQKCGWSNSWRNGVFPYHHYHSITHEVMGVYSGNDILQFGGPDGQQLAVEEGDVIVIPAGVGHKNIRTSHTLKVVGAYPEGMEYDVMLATPSDYKKACANLREVPFPTTDPVFGTDEGICRIWKNFESSS